MNSIAIFSAVLLALIATTNAMTCKPVMCMIACPFGFAVDAEGCPHCSCRTTANVCREPIVGHNCGIIDHRDCPSSHECQLTFSGATGHCCLKPAASTTVSPKSTATTPKPTTHQTGTSTSTARATSSTTRRAFKRSFEFPTGTAPTTRHSTPASTTGHVTRPTTTGHVTRPTTTRHAVSRVQRSAGTAPTTRHPSHPSTTGRPHHTSTHRQFNL